MSKNTKQPTNDASIYTAFRCPPDLLAVSKAAAKAQRRSLSNYIICLLAAAAEAETK